MKLVTSATTTKGITGDTVQALGFCPWCWNDIAFQTIKGFSLALTCPTHACLQSPRIEKRSNWNFNFPPWWWKMLGILVNLHSVMSNSLWPYGLQHARLPCPSPTPGAYSGSCPLSWWCHPNISSSLVPFSSFLQAFPASGYFPMSQFFASGGQIIGASASPSVLPMNIQDWFPLGLPSWISLQSKGLSRVFSNTTVQKHQIFGAQLSLCR